MEVLKMKVLQVENLLLKERIEYLEKQAGIDQLTGASNRMVFERELEQALKIIRGEVEEHRASGKSLSVGSIISIDIDHFKEVNDTLGHPAGDEVLRGIVSLLMKSVRETDTVARVGGEELMVLIPGADEGVALREAEKLRVKIEELSFHSYPELKVTASFGVISSKNSTNAKILYELVDKALYAAKRGGRNRVEIYKEKSENREV